MFVQSVAAVLITSLTVGFVNPSQGRQFKGEIESRDAPRLGFRSDENESPEFVVEPDATIVRDGRAVSLNDLQLDDIATIHAVRRSNRLMTIKINASQPE